jgi:hypothetical protein
MKETLHWAFNIALVAASFALILMVAFKVGMP